MKAHMLTVLVIDFDAIGREDVISAIENARYPNWCIYPHVVAAKQSDIGEWHDRHPLNVVGGDWRPYFEDHVEGDEMPGLAAVIRDVTAERHRQHDRWGEQNHPDGTGGRTLGPNGCMTKSAATVGREIEGLARLQLGSEATYTAILAEEFGEAIQEEDRAKLRAELIQVAAVAVAWVEKLDREEER